MADAWPCAATLAEWHDALTKADVAAGASDCGGNAASDIATAQSSASSQPPAAAVISDEKPCAAAAGNVPGGSPCSSAASRTRSSAVGRKFAINAAEWPENGERDEGQKRASRNDANVSGSAMFAHARTCAREQCAMSVRSSCMHDFLSRQGARLRPEGFYKTAHTFYKLPLRLPCF